MPFPAMLVDVFVKKMQRMAEEHPAIVSIEALSKMGSSESFVDRLQITLTYRSFTVGRPRKLDKKDPRRHIDPNVQTVAVPAVFDPKPNTRPYQADVLVHLRKTRWSEWKTGTQARRKAKELVRLMALRILAEDIGLRWTDNIGFTHRSGVPVEVGFDLEGSPQE